MSAFVCEAMESTEKGVDVTVRGGKAHSHRARWVCPRYSARHMKEPPG